MAPPMWSDYDIDSEACRDMPPPHWYQLASRKQTPPFSHGEWVAFKWGYKKKRRAIWPFSDKYYMSELAVYRLGTL